MKLRPESPRASWNLLPTVKANQHFCRCSICWSFPGDELVFEIVSDQVSAKDVLLELAPCHKALQSVAARNMWKHCQLCSSLSTNVGWSWKSYLYWESQHTLYTALYCMWDSATLRVVALGFFLSLLAWVLFQGPLVCTAPLKGAVVACKIWETAYKSKVAAHPVKSLIAKGFNGSHFSQVSALQIPWSKCEVLDHMQSWGPAKKAQRRWLSSSPSTHPNLFKKSNPKPWNMLYTTHINMYYGSSTSFLSHKVHLGLAWRSGDFRILRFHATSLRQDG